LIPQVAGLGSVPAPQAHSAVMEDPPHQPEPRPPHLCSWTVFTQARHFTRLAALGVGQQHPIHGPSIPTGESCLPCLPTSTAPNSTLQIHDRSFLLASSPAFHVLTPITSCLIIARGSFPAGRYPTFEHTIFPLFAAQDMPSVAQESPSAMQGKKRRLDEKEHIHSSIATTLPLLSGNAAKSASSTSTGMLYSPFAQQNPDASSHINLFSIPQEKTFEHGPLYHHHHHHHSSPLVRKMIPLPAAKRQKVLDDEDRGSGDDRSMRRRQSSPSQQRLQEKSANSRSTTPSHTTAPSAKLMSRCHICGRKPAKKSDLDSFADCQGCSQRTCYVCIRECLGWRASPTPNQQRTNGNETSLGGDSSGFRPSASPTGSDSSFTMVDAEDVAESDMVHHHTNQQTDGRVQHRNNNRPQESNGWAGGGHRQMVCSQCCVEKGENGDVVCLGCLACIEG